VAGVVANELAQVAAQVRQVRVDPALGTNLEEELTVGDAGHGQGDLGKIVGHPQVGEHLPQVPVQLGRMPGLLAFPTNSNFAYQFVVC
jgi:hypothetical protein